MSYSTLTHQTKKMGVHLLKGHQGKLEVVYFHLFCVVLRLQLFLDVINQLESQLARTEAVMSPLQDSFCQAWIMLLLFTPRAEYLPRGISGIVRRSRNSLAISSNFIWA